VSDLRYFRSFERYTIREELFRSELERAKAAMIATTDKRKKQELQRRVWQLQEQVKKQPPEAGALAR